MYLSFVLRRWCRNPAQSFSLSIHSRRYGVQFSSVSAIRFATREKAHYVATDQAHVFQVHNHVAVVRVILKEVAFKKSLQLSYRLCFDPATQDEHCESPPRRSFDPKSHQSGHIAIAAVPNCVLSFRAPITSDASQCPIGFTENRS